MKWQKVSLGILALACVGGSLYYFTHDDNVMGIILCAIGVLSCWGGNKVEDE